MTITEQYKKELYAYIFGIVKNKNSYLHRINGIANHIHLLVDLHPTVALADFVRDIKQWSHKWLKENPNFPKFDSWGVGYYAVSIGVSDLNNCRDYIINQENHHKGRDLLLEMEWLALTSGLDWHKDDWA